MRLSWVCGTLVFTARDLLKPEQKRMKITVLTVKEFEALRVDWTHHGNPNDTDETRGSCSLPYLSLHEMHNDFGHFVLYRSLGMKVNPRAGQEHDMGGREPSHYQEWDRTLVHLRGQPWELDTWPAIVRDYDDTRGTKGGTMPRFGEPLTELHKARLFELLARRTLDRGEEMEKRQLEYAAKDAPR